MLTVRMYVHRRPIEIQDSKRADGITDIDEISYLYLTLHVPQDHEGIKIT